MLTCVFQSPSYNPLISKRYNGPLMSGPHPPASVDPGFAYSVLRGTILFTKLLMVVPCTRIEKTTTAYVTARIMERSGADGIDSARAMEIPPLRPPHVMIRIAPGLNVLKARSSVMGIPTAINREITTQGIMRILSIRY